MRKTMPSPSHAFGAGPSLSPNGRGVLAGFLFPLSRFGEREGPAAKRWEGEGKCV